jgi:hypothetical protein
MSRLFFLLFFVSISASAATLAELSGGSIDITFDKCFSDVECSQEIQPLIVEFSAYPQLDISPMLHDCLGNNGSMLICASFEQFVIGRELLNAQSAIEKELGKKCLKHMGNSGEAAKISRRLKQCTKSVVGYGADSRMQRISCQSEANLSTLAYYRTVAKQCSARLSNSTQ